MFDKFQDNFPSAEVETVELENVERHGKLGIFSTDELKLKLEHIFYPQKVSDIKPEALVNDFLETTYARAITLNDGTVVNLPEQTEWRDTSNSVKEQNDVGFDVSNDEPKPTRELIEDEKLMLQESLDWTDKQISKCTIDEDGVIHYKTDRNDLEGKCGENGIAYERKTIEIQDIKVQGVFPVFDSVCDIYLPADLEKASNARQFRECNRQLKEDIDNNSKIRETFTNEQLEEIEDGDTPTGYVWHHNEEPGKMQLVKVEDHDRTQGGAAHTGGKNLWGGGYSNHEPLTIGERNVAQHPKLDQEVE